jgi:hypothetical protein
MHLLWKLFYLLRNGVDVRKKANITLFLRWLHLLQQYVLCVWSMMVNINSNEILLVCFDGFAQQQMKKAIYIFFYFYLFSISKGLTKTTSKMAKWSQRLVEPKSK